MTLLDTLRSLLHPRPDAAASVHITDDGPWNNVLIAGGGPARSKGWG